MQRDALTERLGLSVPYEWWPARLMLKEIEAAGFSSVQVPSPPASVLRSSRQLGAHARGINEALRSSTLAPMIHAPGSLQAGSPGADRALRGLVNYAAETGSAMIVYHAANFPDRPASREPLLAETRALAALAPAAERLGVTIAIENLAPVFPGPEALSFTPSVLRTMARRIDSPAIGICLDLGHANLVASLRRTDPVELIRPALDRTVLFHLHDNLGARREPADQRPGLDPVRLDLHLPPGGGAVPWDRISPLLRLSKAPLLLEVHPPRPAAARLFRAARRTLAGRRLAVT
jgi:sugar phosphate isomerase/epimerase